MKEEFKLMNLKGTSDFLPEEQIIRNKITDTLKSTFEKYVYHHDALDSELIPDVEDKFDTEDEPEVLVERPKIKVEKRSKFIKK